MTKKQIVLPKVFSDIYHSENPSELEMKYLTLHMKALEEENQKHLLQIYLLAQKNNDENMKNVIIDLVLNWV